MSLTKLPLTQDDKLVFTVTEITRTVKLLLEQTFPRIWVMGEISNLSEPSSGHLYFTLKDEFAQIKAVCFRSARLNFRMKPLNGLEVICFGKLTVYEPRGDYQLIVEKMEPKGLGTFKKLFDATKEKLQKEGLLNEKRKKAIPLYPQRILVITSLTGAAIRDILKVLARSPYPLEISIIPVQVQGEKASSEIANAIEQANVLQPFFHWDVMIVGRGGGSIEDLWAFNEEKVVRSVANSKIPTISAVGHEIDTTLTDLAADVRAITPTAAAELIVDRLKDLENRFQIISESMTKTITGLFFRDQQTLDHLRERLKSPQQIVQTRLDKVEDLRRKLVKSLLEKLDTTHRELLFLKSSINMLRPEKTIKKLSDTVNFQRKFLETRLLQDIEKIRSKIMNLKTIITVLNPYEVLKRGYAIVVKERDRSVLLDSTEVTEGDVVRVKLARGLLMCKVESIEIDTESDQGKGGDLM